MEGKEIEEQWLPVKGYEGLYEVSDWGNVRSLNYRRTVKTRLLKTRKNSSGYLVVCLCKNGKPKQKFVHRLVAEAFITNPKPNEYKEVNHKSECRMLNFACVLEWCDRKHNVNYGTGRARHDDALSKPVDQFDKDGNFIRRWKSAMEVQRQLGINQGNISNCAYGRCKTTGGYIWKYAEVQ